MNKDNARLRRQRNDAIYALDEALRFCTRYIELHGEPSRLVGVIPDLEAVRLRFERGTAPEETADEPPPEDPFAIFDECNATRSEKQDP